MFNAAPGRKTFNGRQHRVFIVGRAALDVHRPARRPKAVEASLENEPSAHASAHGGSGTKRVGFFRIHGARFVAFLAEYILGQIVSCVV
ncbi:hypothetical protein [Pendulispora albinea]|uniref:Uncharacterized protein n=1 Tax=Pendulispora albinea TaxID=2741071 RepID=A0ABZ2M1H9_9BACT